MEKIKKTYCIITAILLSLIVCLPVNAYKEPNSSVVSMNINGMNVVVSTVLTEETKDVSIITPLYQKAYSLDRNYDIENDLITVAGYADYLLGESPETFLAFIQLKENEQQEVVDIMNELIASDDLSLLRFGETELMDDSMIHGGIAHPNISVENRYVSKVQNIYAGPLCVAKLKIELEFAVYGSSYAQYVSGNATIQNLLPGYPITRTIFQLYNSNNAAYCYAKWTFGWGSGYAIGQAWGDQYGRSEANIWPYY